MEKGRYVTVIEGEEVRRNDPIEYFLPTRVGSTLCVPERMLAIEFPQDEEIFEGRKEWREKTNRFCYPSEKSKWEKLKQEKSERGGVD